MVDNAQKVQVTAELNAGQVESEAQKAARAFKTLLTNVRDLEAATKSLFNGNNGTLGRQLADLTRQLQAIQQLPVQAAAVGRVSRGIASGGGSTMANSAAMAGAMANIRTDPAFQNLQLEREVNKVLGARAEIYRRVREALPDGATALRTSQVYRQALQSIGDMPEKGTAAYRDWQNRTLGEVREFERRWTETARVEADKRARNQLKVSKETNAQELRQQREHARELNRLFGRDMHSVMNGNTPEERARLAGEAVGRVRDYAGRTGMTGFNERELYSRYEDAEARRSARDMNRTIRPQLSDDERAGNAYRQRDAFNNYNGGANRLAGRFQFAGDFAAVGAVMGTAMYAGRSTVELQTELKNLQAITKATDTEMKSLQGTIFAVGQTTKYSTTQIAEAATVMGQAGYSAAQIREALPAMASLATAAGGELADTVSTVTSVLSIYDLSIDRTANVSNMLAEALNGSKLSFQQLSLGLQYAGNVAADGGVQFEELTSALGAMANAGIRSGSTLGTGLRALIQELENPSDKFIEWLRGVGLTANDVDIRTQGLAGAISNLTAKSFDSGAAMNVFEIRAASAFSALSNNLDVMLDLQTSMENTNAATEGAKTQMESLSAQASRMGNALTEFTTVAGAPFMAFLTGAFGATASLLSLLADGGPIVQILMTALIMLIAVGVVKWLGTMLLGFTALTPAMIKTNFATMMTTISTRGLAASMGLAASSVKAFTVALIASPVGIFAIALTALAVAFGANEAAAARSKAKLDEWRTKANEASAEAQKYSDRVSELASFMEMVSLRSNTMASETVLAGQMAETAAAKFSSWGLVLEGNITTIDQLIAALARLSREQATAAVNQKNLELTAKQGERETIMGQNPWGGVRSAASGLTTQFSGESRFAAPTADSSATTAVLNTMPANIKALMTKARTGQMTQNERNVLSGWLQGNLARFPTTARPRVTAFVNSLNSSAINDLFRLDREIGNLRTEISVAGVAASPEQEAAAAAAAAQTRVNLQSERTIAGINDPSQRVRAGAAYQESSRQLAGRNDVYLGQLADSMMARDPNLATGLQERARMMGVSVRDLLVAQLKRQNPGFGRVELAGGNLDALDNPTAIRARERALKAQIADAASLSNPTERDSVRQGLQTQLREVTMRRLSLDNPDLDAVTIRSMLDDEMSGSGANVNRTQETSEQRAARDRAKSLKDRRATFESQIEGASINTRTVAGATGTASEQQAMQFLISKGLTPAQAAGIVGNLVHESGGMNTRALGDNGTAYGLAQWRGDRQDNLRSFASARGTGADDMTTQLEFMWKEMQERGDLARVQAQSTAAGAAEAFARHYERPQGVDGPLAQMAGWSDRLANANRLAGSGSTTEIDQTAVRVLLDQWKENGIELIRAEGRAANISDAEMGERLADFEVEAATYFNDVLTGNATRAKQEMAAAASRFADGFAASTTLSLRGGAADLDESLAQIRDAMNLALAAELEASDADFRAQNPNVNPAISGEAAAKRREIQDTYAVRIVNATLAAVAAVFEGEAERAAQEIARLRNGLEQDRTGIAMLSNSNGMRRLGEVQRTLGGMRGEDITVREGGVAVREAEGQYNNALANQQRLERERATAGTDEERAGLDGALIDAAANTEAMAINLERARLAFQGLAGEAPAFTSMTEAWNGALTVFADQAGINRGMFEDLSDGLLNSMNTAKAGFKTLVVDVLSGSKSMGDAFKDFTMSILESLLDLAAEMLAKQVIMWVLQMMGVGGPGNLGGSFSGVKGTGAGGVTVTGVKGAWHGGPIRMAGGGRVPGTDSSRDSKLILGMPGEVMMSKSAVDMVGEDNLLALNARANSRMSGMPTVAQAMGPAREPDTVNVWVVSPEQKPGVGKRDIVAAITEDMMTGGKTKQLVKAIAVGAA